jgi:hypothetical protein
LAEQDSRVVARVHEAGHTIVALCLGIDVERVIAKDIGQATTSALLPPQLPAVKRAAYYLAGKAAEGSVLGALDDRTGSEDYEALERLGLSRGESEQAKRLAACCIDENGVGLQALILRLAQLPPAVHRAELERLLGVADSCAVQGSE